MSHDNVLDTMSEAEIDDLMARAESGDLSEDDQTKFQTILDALSDAMPVMLDAINEVFGLFFGPLFDNVSELVGAFNGFLAELGIEARMATNPTWRTEPIPGAELGGRPRNPEDDVIDEIDRLVDWQLKGGSGW